MPSCTRPACLSSCTLCNEMAVQANSRWNICLRLFLLSLWQKLSLCLQYRKQSMPRSSLISSAFASFSLPPILLLKPLQFLPIILNIPGCLVFGGLPCICSSRSWTASSTHHYSSLIESSQCPSSAFVSLSLSLFSLMISSTSSF